MVSNRLSDLIVMLTCAEFVDCVQTVEWNVKRSTAIDSMLRRQRAAVARGRSWQTSRRLSSADIVKQRIEEDGAARHRRFRVAVTTARSSDCESKSDLVNGDWRLDGRLES